MKKTTYINYCLKVLNYLFRDVDNDNTQKSYINSSSMQRRRTVRAERAEYDPLFQTYPQLDILEDSLLKAQNIGPYESTVLARVIDDSSCYLFFQGGTKSGKSTTFIYLKKYIDNYLNELIFDDNSCPIDLVNMTIVDMGDYIEDPSGVGNEDSEVEAACNQLINKIVAEYSSLDIFEIGWENICHDVFTGNIVAFPEENFITSINDFAAKYSHRFESFLGLKEQHQKSLIRELLHLQHGVITKLQLAIAPFWWAAKKAKANGLSSKYIIVLDNIDPLPEKVQQGIALTIKFISKDKSFIDKSIKIVIPLRLSTYKRKIAQNESFVSEEHKGFYPSDYLVYKICHFLLFPNKYWIASADDEVKSAIYGRLLSIWANIINEKTNFCETLDSLCGTNLSKAKTLVANWCITGGFESPSINRDTFNNINRELSQIIATNFVKEAWILLRNAYLDALKENYSNTLSIQVNAENCSASFIENMADVLRDLRWICYPSEKNNICARRAIAFKIIKLVHCILTTSCNNFKNKDPKSINDFKDKSMQLLALTHDYIPKDRDKSVFLSHFLTPIKNCVKVFYQTCSNDLKSNFDSSLSKLIRNWMLLLFHYASQNTQSKYEGMFGFNKRIIGSPYATIVKSDVIQKHLPQISVYKSVSTLFEDITHNPHFSKNQTPKFMEVVPDNVFVAGGKISAVPLHILYILYYSINLVEKCDSLFAKLSIYDYAPSIIDKAIKYMINIDRRLIFTDVNDYSYAFISFENKTTTDIFLSSTGKAYINHLVFSPAYLTWCFSKYFGFDDSNDSPNQPDKFIRQIPRIRLITSTIAEEAFAEIKLITKKTAGISISEKRSNIPVFLSAFSNVYIKSLRFYLFALLNHRQERKKKGNSTRITDELILKMLNDGHLLSTQMMELSEFDYESTTGHATHANVVSSYFTQIENDCYNRSGIKSTLRLF